MKLIEIAPVVRFVCEIAMNERRTIVTPDSRLFYITEGAGTVYADKEYPFAPGTLLLWQAGTPYRFAPSEPTKAISVNFDFTAERAGQTDPLAFFEAANAPEIEPIVFEDCPLLSSPLVLRGREDVPALLRLMISENTVCEPYYRERLSALMKEVLMLLLRSAGRTAKTDSVVLRLTERIHRDYAQPLSNETLSREFSYHPYYLNKLFSDVYGVTMHKYLIRYRLSVAERLLLTTRDSVSSIAQSVGFSDALSFAAAFRKKNHLSPTEFRRRYGV